MTSATRPRGGAPVGLLEDLDPLPLSAVIYLRLWCDGHRDQLRQDLLHKLGPEAARRAGAEFDHLCNLCLRHGRRKLCRHHLQCKCLGADESCFATFLQSAALGEDADAMLIASLMLRAEQVPLSTALAQSIGSALQQANDFAAEPEALNRPAGQLYPTPHLAQ